MTGSSPGKRKLPRYLVDAITGVDCLQDRHTAQQILRGFGGPSAVVPDLSDPTSRRSVLVPLLERLTAQHAGLAFLIQELELLEGNSPGIRELRLAYAHWEFDVMSRSDWFDLFELLEGVHLADLPQRYADYLAATNRPPPRTDCTEPWVAFLHAALFNAGPSESPPCFEVLSQIVALGAAGEHQERIVKWARAHDPCLGEPPPPAARLSVPFTEPTHWRPANYLIIRLRKLAQSDRHGHDLQLSHWLQVARAFPVRQQDRRISSLDAEREVRDLLREVEAEWSARLHDGELAIEFVLPSELLGLAVERWSKFPFRGASARLGEDHVVIIRSLDRWERPDLHGAWGRRWTVFTDGAGGPAHLFTDHQRADLRTEPARSVAVLSGAPHDSSAEALAELSEALLAGFPIVLWDRSGDHDTAFRSALAQLLTGKDPRELPKVVHDLRIRADEPSDQAVLGHRLALMWDDPQRMPIGYDAAEPDSRS